ncbi:lysoplasmalogenase [Lutibacter sp.]|uniref:lysoplasmalogenase n=1 Tax=Lutibacter sp. TaxID=1925666 RepID=UPI0025C3C3FD|nr:lysoplasmalogenase [Lutibacter sp.]MCF6180964.1 lysoplasmalogenase [Lutibacter sp.]
MNKIKVTFFVFVLASILDIVGIIFSIPILIYIFKPLIIFSLLFLYVFSLPKRLKWYVMALELSFFGDVLLLFTGNLFFIAGLVSFLLAHILFIKIVISRIKTVNFLKLAISVIPFLVTFILLIFTLKDSLHEMLLPVIIYGVIISTFGTVSLLAYLNKKSKKSMLMLFGAIFFMISDSLLAINKFYNPAHILEVIVMATYVIAQYLIFKSMIQKNVLQS